MLACWAVSVDTIVHNPRDAGMGVIILAIGIVVYQFWRKSGALPEPDFTDVTSA